MKKLLIIAAAFLLIISYFYKKPETKVGERLNIYYTESSGAEGIVKGLQPVPQNIYAADNLKKIKQVIELLRKSPSNNYQSPLPENLNARVNDIFNDTAVIRLSASTGTISNADKAVAIGAIVLSVDQLDGIEIVNIIDEMNVVYRDRSKYYKAKDFLLSDDQAKLNVFNIKIYYVDNKNKKLAETTVEVKTPEREASPDVVIDKLFSKPLSINLSIPFNQVATVKAVHVSEYGICRVDIESRQPSALILEDPISFYAIAKSLYQLDNIVGVIFSINGKPPSEYDFENLDGVLYEK